MFSELQRMTGNIDISLPDDNAWSDWPASCNITLLFIWRFFVFVDVFFAWVWSKLLDLLSILSRFRFCSTKQLCVLSWRDPSICRVLFFSSSFVIRRVLCPRCDLLDVNLCVDTALMKKWLGIECCLLSGACTFLRKKYSYLDVAPEPLAFRNEELEGLLKFNFGWLVLGVSF